ncbi:MAG: hypothetical protein SH856_04835 [Flavobacteriales bacterium]|nr:hypothetical protein [Flavobacteriales bacterium]
MELKREYPALLPDRFQEIGLWQLDKFFLEPFGNNEHRRQLINRLQVFMSEVQALGVGTEVWIDGSFTTEKPEPDDVDMVFLMNREDIDNLPEAKAAFFQSLFMQRDEVRSRYHLDVYFIDKDDRDEVEKWTENFGKDARKLNSKGIFKIQIKPGV